jgi:hypothetical protein
VCADKYGTFLWLLSLLACNCIIYNVLKCQMIAYDELEKIRVEAVVT